MSLPNGVEHDHSQVQHHHHQPVHHHDQHHSSEITDGASNSSTTSKVSTAQEESLPISSTIESSGISFNPLKDLNWTEVKNKALRAATNLPLTVAQLWLASQVAHTILNTVAPDYADKAKLLVLTAYGLLGAKRIFEEKEVRRVLVGDAAVTTALTVGLANLANYVELPFSVLDDLAFDGAALGALSLLTAATVGTIQVSDIALARLSKLVGGLVSSQHAKVGA